MAQARDGANQTLEQLLAQQEDIARQIQLLKDKARNESLEKIKDIMVSAGLTPKDLMAVFGSQPFGGKRRSAAPSASSENLGNKAPTKGSGKVAMRYKDPSTGEGWSGRGLQPRWLKARIEAGAQLEDFRVKVD